jgi:hypothetical protein
VVKDLPSMWEDLGSFPSTSENKQNKQTRDMKRKAAHTHTHTHKSTSHRRTSKHVTRLIPSLLRPSLRKILNCGPYT